MDVQANLIPFVIKRDPNGMERSYDIYSRLLEDFIIFVTGPVESGMANTFIAQMLFLESQDPTRDINIYINSPGGDVYAGFAMYDTIKHVKNPVSTINVGLAASAAALILVAGNKGKRLMLPGAFSLIHQVLTHGLEGQATEIEIQAKHMLKLRRMYADAIAKDTGQEVEKVLRDIERDNWLDATESKKYGLVDKIMEPKKVA
jgi:ATP-dependent Clp protease protease subunit